MSTNERAGAAESPAKAAGGSAATDGQDGLSAMLWFRADRSKDAEVRVALAKVAQAIAADAVSRIGHRHDEDKPYRTWMIDAGPIPAEHFDALLYRMHKLLGSTGLSTLMKGEAHLESFAWEPGETGGN